MSTRRRVPQEFDDVTDLEANFSTEEASRVLGSATHRFSVHPLQGHGLLAGPECSGVYEFWLSDVAGETLAIRLLLQHTGPPKSWAIQSAVRSASSHYRSNWLLSWFLQDNKDQWYFA